MYEGILVPLDGSSLSLAVLPMVGSVAKKLGSRVVLLHVVETPVEPIYDQTGTPVAQAREGAHSVAVCYLRDVAPAIRVQGVPVETVVLEGRPYEQIVRYAEAEQLDLIAMATHGRAGMRRAALGSVATRVLETSSRPLLLIRPHHVEAGFWSSPFTKPKRIVVPLDGSDLAEAAIPYAEELALHLSLPLALIQVLPMDADLYLGPYEAGPWTSSWEANTRFDTIIEGYLMRLGRQLIHKGIKTDWAALRGRPARSIMDFAREVPGTIVVMTTHGRSGWRRWMLGSVTDEVVREAAVPVLIVAAERTEKAALRTHLP